MIAKPRLSLWSLLVLAACALVLSAYSVVALTEMHTQTMLLPKRMLLPFRMHYDSAWAFLFCGLSLFAFLGGSRGGAILSALAVMAIGCARWAAYLFPELGLPVHPLLANPALAPGEYDDLSLLAASGLALSGIALLALKRPPYSAVRSVFIALSGFMIVVLGFFLLIGSQSHASFVYDWTQLDSNDAINALDFLVVGGAVLFFLFFGRNREQVEARRWMALAIWLTVLAGTLALWQGMRTEQVRDIQARTQFVAAAVQLELEGNLQERVRLLERVAGRWQSLRAHKEQWSVEMTQLLGDVPEFRALGWADSRFIVRWFVPDGTDAIGSNLFVDRGSLAAATTARLSGKPAVTDLIDIAPGQKGFYVYVPVYADDRFQGLMIGVVMRAGWLESLLWNRFTLYSISLRSGDDVIGELRPAEKVDGRWINRRDVAFHNVTWTLEVSPTQTTLNTSRTVLPRVALVVGLILATLLAFVVFFFQISLRRIADTAAANRLLALDIEARKRTERALVESERKNRLVAEEARDHYFRLFSDFPNLVWRSDATGQCDYCNQAWFDFTGATLKEMRGEGWLDSLHADDRAAWVEAFAQAREGPRPFEIQYRLRRKDGQYGWIICTCRPYHNMRGEFAGYLASCYDNTTRRQMESELEASRERMRSFSRHLQAAREEEKARIARELHDELGATLTALRMDSSWLSRRVSSDDESAVKKSRDIVQLADSAIQLIRRIITELRPSILDNLGLIAALRWQAAEFQGRAGLKISVLTERQEMSVGKPQAIAFFRIFQEALTNIAKHADAKNVAVRFGASGFSHVLEVTDDGVGISEEALAKRAGHGVLGMQERAQEMNGECSISSEPGKGTTVRVSLPWTLSRDSI